MKASNIKKINNTNNIVFNKKIPVFKPNTKMFLKSYNITEKMYLYDKKKEEKNFPIELISGKKNNANSYYNIKNILKANKNNIKQSIQSNARKKNNSTSMKYNTVLFNNNNHHFINSKYNYSNIKEKIINNNSLILNSNLKNTDTNKNTHNSLYHIYNNNNKNNNLIKTFIINSFNVTLKDYLGKRISVSNPRKQAKTIIAKEKEYKKEINLLMKERDECNNLIKKQEKLIEKLEEDNQKLENDIKSINYENSKIKEKIKKGQDNQEQLVLLVKVIQQNSDIDLEELIDKWNNDVENEQNENSKNDSCSKNKINNEGMNESYNESKSNLDTSNFIPINIDKPKENKIIYNGIPKLNFDILKNNTNKIKKEKFKNHSK